MSIKKTFNFILRHPLGSKNKIRSIYRYLNWQIRSRLSKNYHTINWVNDAKFLAQLGDAGLTGNIYVGLHEFQDMGFLLHYLRLNDLFLDIGANAGSFTILASKVVGAKTIAIEPIPRTFEKLESNIVLNKICQNVQALNIGLSCSPGNLKFTSNLDCMNHVINESSCISGNVNSIDVNVETLDTITSGKDISLIKIDVEGYELQVLMGATDVLKSKSLAAIIMEVNKSASLYDYNHIEILEMLNKYSFSGYNYDPFKRSLVKVKNIKDLNGNVIFIKNLEFVRKRLEESLRFNVNGIYF